MKIITKSVHFFPIFAVMLMLAATAFAEDIPAPADVAAAPENAELTDSGLASKVVQVGTGAKHPDASSTVTVHYSGWTTDGKMFDSAVSRSALAWGR